MRRRKRQNKYFEFEDITVESDFTNWIMLMVYAKSINKEKFTILNELSYSKDTSGESHEVVFNEMKLRTAIDFLDELIDRLKEEEELYDKYPEETLIAITNADPEEDFPFIDEGNNLPGDNEMNIKYLEDLKNKILIHSLEAKKPYEVYVM